ncbi:MAG: hypothetical protein ABI690_12980 [Chloroflexota bacterium]
MNTQYEISPEIVKDALDSLVYTTQLRNPNPLENMILVDQLLMKWQLFKWKLTRTYALDYLLTSFIEEKVFSLRYACDLQSGVEGSIREIRAAIMQDTQTLNPELISWSLIYYFYVRVEFNISMKEYCQLYAVNERTFRRYRAHGVRRLTAHLIRREYLMWQRTSQPSFEEPMNEPDLAQIEKAMNHSPLL